MGRSSVEATKAFFSLAVRATRAARLERCVAECVVEWVVVCFGGVFFVVLDLEEGVLVLLEADAPVVGALVSDAELDWAVTVHGTISRERRAAVARCARRRIRIEGGQPRILLIYAGFDVVIDIGEPLASLQAAYVGVGHEAGRPLHSTFTGFTTLLQPFHGSQR
jgi:hypothetical protein